MRKFSKLSEASILAALGAQCRLMCSAAAHKIEQLHHAGVCWVWFTTDRARLPEGSSSSRLILDSPPASDPEEGEGSRLRVANHLYHYIY